MNKTDIRRIINEEISRAITENKPKFKQGEHFKYMGTDHEVINDNGFIVTAMTKNGNKVKLNHNQLKNIFTENTLKSQIPLPGTYKIEYSKERRSSFDSITINISDSDINKAVKYNINGIHFWREVVEDKDPFFTPIDSIIQVTRINK